MNNNNNNKLTNKKMELVRSILTLSIELSNNTTTDIFTDYFGHVNGFTVRIYVEGWKSNIPADINITVYLEENCIDKLEMIYKTLKNIEEEFKNENN